MIQVTNEHKMEIDLSLFVMINNIDDEKNIWLCRQNQLKICYMIPFMKRISADVNDRSSSETLKKIFLMIIRPISSDKRT